VEIAAGAEEEEEVFGLRREGSSPRILVTAIELFLFSLRLR